MPETWITNASPESIESDMWDRLRMQAPHPIMERTAPVRMWTTQELEETLNKLRADVNKNEIKIRRLEYTLGQFDEINKEATTLIVNLMEHLSELQAEVDRLRNRTQN